MLGHRMTSSAGGIASVTWTAAPVLTADQTTYTFSSVSLGTAQTNRRIVVAVSGAVSAARTVSSVTINGVSAAAIAGTEVQRSTFLDFEFWHAAVPDDATGDIVVVWDGSRQRCGIGVWAIYGASATEHAVVTDIADEWTQNIVVPPGGVVIAATLGITSATRSWTSPMVEDYDGVIESTTYQSGASYASAAGETVTVVMDPDTGTPVHSMVAVSFGPA